MNRNARTFGRTGVYTCRCCKHNTRQTGRGDNEHVQLCAACYDLAGEENSLSDNGKFYQSPEFVLELIGSVKGDASCWDELKAQAQAAIAERTTNAVA